MPCNLCDFLRQSNFENIPENYELLLSITTVNKQSLLNCWRYWFLGFNEIFSLSLWIAENCSEFWLELLGVLFWVAGKRRSYHMKSKYSDRWSNVFALMNTFWANFSYKARTRALKTVIFQWNVELSKLNLFQLTRITCKVSLKWTSGEIHKR